MGKLETIVAGYDDTEPAQRALERAADLAEAFSARLLVTSVAEPPLPPDAISPTLGAPEFAPAPMRDEGRIYEDAHREQLTHARATLAKRGVDAEFVLGHGAPEDWIVQLASERGADLIVVGTRRPGFFDRLVSGSVSEGVSRHARCDVLIVH